MEDEPAPRPAIVSGPNLPGRKVSPRLGTGVFNTLSGNTGSRITYQQGSFLGFDTGSRTSSTRTPSETATPTWA